MNDSQTNTKELARRIEALETLSAIDTLETYAKHEPNAEVALIRITSGVASFGGEGSFLNKAQGLGMRGPVSAEEFDRLENFFRRRGVPPQIELCPLADESLHRLLQDRGYREVGKENVFWRKLDEIPKPAEISGVVIDELGPEGETDYALTVAAGFLAAEGESFSEAEIQQAGLEECARLIRLSFRSPFSRCFLARCDGIPAGGGILIAQGDAAGVYGASTLPHFRRRGIQNALLNARLHAAKETGCDLVATTTLPGSTSHRNVERAGFQLAYTKSILLGSI